MQECTVQKREKVRRYSLVSSHRRIIPMHIGGGIFNKPSAVGEGEQRIIFLNISVLVLMAALTLLGLKAVI